MPVPLAHAPALQKHASADLERAREVMRVMSAMGHEVQAACAVMALYVPAARGLHSSAFQLNLSCF